MYPVARLVGIAGLAIGLSACGTLYKLDVTSYSDPGAEVGKTYIILPGSSSLDINSQEFDTFAAQVERALDTKGYTRVPGEDLSSAALGIYISAVISDPSKKFHTVTSGVYEKPYAENTTSAVRSSGNSGSQNTQRPVPVPAPTPEVLAGYEQAGFATTVFTKQLNIVAVDLQRYLRDIATVGKSEAVASEVWSVDVETTGQPSDLSAAVPVMVAAGMPYIGASSESVVSVKLSETDPRVTAIKTRN
jgi:hypothetical protein